MTEGPVFPPVVRPVAEDDNNTESSEVVPS